MPLNQAKMSLSHALMFLNAQGAVKPLLTHASGVLLPLPEPCQPNLDKP